MTDVITRLILEAQGTKEAEKQIADLRKEQARLEKEIKEGARSTDLAEGAMKELVAQYKKAIAAERELADEVDRVNDKFGERRKSIDAQNRFDRTSQGVALAGDVESNLRTIGGAAGAFGARGIEQGLAGGSEIFAVV